MANNCMYEMRVEGDPDNVRELEEKLAGLGRIYTADTRGDWRSAQRAGVSIEGDCAWSLETALGIELRPDSEFRREVARLGLTIEAYSSEPGIGFQEHYVLKGANLVVAEETPYREYWFEDDEEIAEDVAEELGVEVGMLPLMAVGGPYDDTLAIGGYEWSFDGSGAAQPGPTLEELRAGALRKAAA